MCMNVYLYTLFSRLNVSLIDHKLKVPKKLHLIEKGLTKGGIREGKNINYSMIIIHLYDTCSVSVNYINSISWSKNEGSLFL